MPLQTRSKKPRSSRSEDVYKVLEKRILAWEYPPGHRLKEDELCKEFNVSRIPVREALSRLSQIHLVERKPNVGCTVKRWSVNEINDLYELRIALESYVSESLANNPPSEEVFAEQIAAWRQHLEASKCEGFPKKSWFTADEAFHESLVIALGNQQILTMLRDINSRLRFLRVKDITNAQVLADSSKQHLAIMDAILAGNAELAVATVRSNIRMGKDNVKAALQDVLLRAFEV
ncbi:GntR family transcriptional regulator [Cerasicoccus frondis]|uniref:GntR family transcriptional regulator n=1 Tax=Cerasicoccus frondis TaxID=490090 RepID=UPI002852D856|nr:GntR family transcriptional regulator [Cerasicoccus frondis]